MFRIGLWNKLGSYWVILYLKKFWSLRREKTARDSIKDLEKLVKNLSVETDHSEAYAWNA